MKTLKESGLSKKELLKAYRFTLLGRRLDERMWQLTRVGKSSFNISGQGAELAQVAMAMAFDTDDKDYFLPYYRDMTACLVWGMTLKDILMGTFAKADDPSSHGRQMPNHYGSKEHKIVSHSSVVSTQYTLATGVAMGAQLSNDDYVTLTTTGDGSFNQGECAESMNFAAIKKLPLIFVVENNGYAISVGNDEQFASETLAMRGPAFGMPGVRVDGSDFTETYLTFKKFAEEARKGKGPALIEVMVERLTSHSADDDHTVYRSKEDLEDLKNKDSLLVIEKQLIDEGYATEDELKAIDEEVKKEVNQATDEAEAMPDPTIESMYEDVWAN
ncbi:MAG TPA: thiamine pyrophosphate-dependent dehydrogenase E1 component subunit alpha [Alloiococcus sp.]|nr:thiamine pyrophosphate-dependent dehydrogenase E1 component subunit alpha [Alloiococcus sp.]